MDVTYNKGQEEKWAWKGFIQTQSCFSTEFSRKQSIPMAPAAPRRFSSIPGGLEGWFALERDSSATKMTHLGLDREVKWEKTQREDTRQFPTDPHTAKASVQGEKINYSWKKFH